VSLEQHDMKNFRNYLVLALAISACSDQNTLDFRMYELEEPIVTSVDSSFGVRLPTTETITTQILSISDSRCPEDVVCITAGQYSARIELALPPDKAIVDLCNGDCNAFKKDSAKFTLRSTEYWIRMDDLTPYPSTKNPDPDYQLWITIFAAN